MASYTWKRTRYLSNGADSSFILFSTQACSALISPCLSDHSRTALLKTSTWVKRKRYPLNPLCLCNSWSPRGWCNPNSFSTFLVTMMALRNSSLSCFIILAAMCPIYQFINHKKGSTHTIEINSYDLAHIYPAAVATIANLNK